MKKIIAVTALLLGVSLMSFAQHRTAGIDAREAMQRGRIREGRVDGDLTRREAFRLHKQQRHIHRDERRAKADGQVTRHERRRLKHEQNRASRNIRRQKHDRQHAG